MDNPWTTQFWNLTAQGDVVRQWGLVTAQRLASEAGTTVGGPMPKEPNDRPIIRNYILTKRIGSQSSGGKGYSGTGVPTNDLSGN